MTIRILLLLGHGYSCRLWRRVAAALAECVPSDGPSSGPRIETRMARQHEPQALADLLEWEGPFDLAVVLGLPGAPFLEECLELTSGIPQRIVLSGSGDAPSAYTTFAAHVQAVFRQYLAVPDHDNFRNGILFLLSTAGWPVTAQPAKTVPDAGIYHPDSERLFADLDEYSQWLNGRFKNEKRPARPLVALLCSQAHLAEGERLYIDTFLRLLESHGMTPLCIPKIQSENTLGLPREHRYPWLAFVREANCAALCNMTGSRFVQTGDQDVLEDLDLPVFQLICTYGCSTGQWLDQARPLPPFTVNYALTQPECTGIIEPAVIACEEKDEEGLPYFKPLADSMERVCRRIGRWARLRATPPEKRRVVIMLHNAPCKGVEATIGAGSGLDVLESVVRLMRAMKGEGYDAANVPADAKGLYDAILARKAISEFRWTTVEEIGAKGGVLHYMGADEYHRHFSALPSGEQAAVTEAWGEFPGDGMALERDGEPHLLITGLAFGNVTVMVQPKRGCYGAKCNGEVCRILHDPEIPPPPHWLAVYAWVNEHAEAVIHVGTEGALEYLPGKRQLASENSFSAISIGDIPNLHVYLASATGPGVSAKRRAKALVAGHLPPPCRNAAASREVSALRTLVEEFNDALAANDTGKLGELAPVLRSELDLVRAPENASPDTDDFTALARGADRQLALRENHLMPMSLHVLGQIPDDETARAYLDMVPGMHTGLEPLVREGLGRTHDEMRAVLRFMKGGFLRAGPSGSLSVGQTDCLPTGRNIHPGDLTHLPGTAAWEKGRKNGDALLRKYLEDCGEFPGTVGVTVWSSDAFCCDGEQLAQALWLMGVKPAKNDQGRTTGVEVVPLGELLLDGAPRPRVDVLIQTSSMARDLVPLNAFLIDRAVAAVAALDEPFERNAVRAHVEEDLVQLREERSGPVKTLAQTPALVLARVFSTAPGAYGSGLGLAIDASAWEREQDLAEIYVTDESYAYDGDGNLLGHRPDDLARHMGRVDVSYMQQSDPAYSLLSCSGMASSLGGMALAAGAVRKRPVKTYWKQSGDHAGTLADLSEALAADAATSILSEEWWDAVKQHGQQGAMGVSGLVNTIFAWSMLGNAVTDSLCDRVAEVCLRDENRNWLRRENPYALEEVTRRLKEAHSRNKWNASEEALEALRDALLEVEGDMEESRGDAGGECQGGEVEVLTQREVIKWQKKWRLNDVLWSSHG